MTRHDPTHHTHHAWHYIHHTLAATTTPCSPRPHHTIIPRRPDPGFKDYVIHRLPQLESLDGTHITKSMRIVAAQAYPRLEGELKQKAAECRVRKAVEAEAEAEEKSEKDAKKAARAEAIEAGEIEDVEEEEEEDEECPHTPAARVEMYKELAEEKAEKEAREKERQPKDRDFDKEQVGS